MTTLRDILNDLIVDTGEKVDAVVDEDQKEDLLDEYMDKIKNLFGIE